MPGYPHPHILVLNGVLAEGNTVGTQSQTELSMVLKMNMEITTFGRIVFPTPRMKFSAYKTHFAFFGDNHYNNLIFIYFKFDSVSNETSIIPVILPKRGQLRDY